MPELPDVALYVESLRTRVCNSALEGVVVSSPSVLKTYDPPLSALSGRQVLSVDRLGKQIVLSLTDEYHIVLHLMILGRLKWRDVEPAATRKPTRARPRRSPVLALFGFTSGELLFTESGTKHRASLHVVRGKQALAAFDRGGLEILSADLKAFRETLLRESHTLKRTLTDPRLFSGVGNAYSDEILHRAGLSPLKLTRQLDADETQRLYGAAKRTLADWVERLRKNAAGEFPKKVSAFQEGMAVHGRHNQPCPDCGTAVQRIVYAETESNYCPTCQTGGKLLADRALSRLLKGDWPRTLAELEQMRRPQ